MGQGDGHDDEPLDAHDEVPEDDVGDEPDDADRRPRRLPDPLDRVWLHPTELSVLGAGFAPPEAERPGARHRPFPWLVPVLAGATGALLAVAVLAIAGAFDRSSNAPSSAHVVDAATTPVSSATDTLASLSPSVVAVLASDVTGSRRGSGVCVRHGSEVLTSTRVVGDAEQVQIVTADGRRHPAHVVGRDLVTDLVLLDLDDQTDVPAAPLAIKTPTTGTSVYLLGATMPGSKSPWMSGGMTSSNDAMVASETGPTTSGLLETDAASNNAVVGGALVDTSGSVAGIVLGHVNGSTTTFAVSIGVAVEVAHQLDANGVATHGTLGVRGVDTPTGPMFVAVPKSAPAAKAGARVDDRVESVDGRPVDSVSQLTALVRGMDPGKVIDLDLRRGKDTVEVHVQLGATTG